MNRMYSLSDLTHDLLRNTHIFQHFLPVNLHSMILVKEQDRIICIASPN